MSVVVDLRDYFIAHAPAVPHDWFLPRMPTECVAVPIASHIKDDELRRAINDWHEGIDCEQHMCERVDAWLAHRKECERLQAEWQAEFRKQLYVQWPAAWADEMLKARAA